MLCYNVIMENLDIIDIDGNFINKSQERKTVH